MTLNRKLHSMAVTIVALGEEAGCTFLIGPQSLVALPSPDHPQMLAAEDVVSREEAASSEFTDRLCHLGINHPNIGLAAALYARLARLCATSGRSTFDGVGKTAEEITAFSRPLNPEPQQL